MITWQPIADYREPNYDKPAEPVAPVLFWRPAKGATFGFIRDGELFNSAWIYVSDSNKVSHFCAVNGPDAP